MADPHVRHLPRWPDDELPECWTVGCCAAVDHGDGYSTERAAVAALADHLDAEHRMTVREVPVVDLGPDPAYGAPDAAIAHGHHIVTGRRTVAVPITAEVTG